MHTHLDCIPCFVRQTLDAARNAGLDDAAATVALKDALAHLQTVDLQRPPPLTGGDIHRIVASACGRPDPYAAVKRRHTEAALSLLPTLNARIAAAPWPFRAACAHAIAGNAIDLGVAGAVHADVDRAFCEATSHPIDEDAVARLERAARAAGSILFLADNAGELVFDRPLLHLLGADKVTVVVRGGPVINDVTREDAERSGVTAEFQVMDSGSALPGTWLPACSPSFQEAFAAASLIVAKGQGNFETLLDVDAPLAFLFLVKCPVVAGLVDRPVGTPIVKYP